MERRAFLAAASLGAASYRRAPGANDKIQVGIIGLGGNGFGQHVQGLLALKDKAEIVAVCDIYKPRLEQGVAATRARGYHDYNDLLADKNVEAVIISTPDHWHARMAIDAMRAGKDVDVEKRCRSPSKKPARWCAFRSKPAGCWRSTANTWPTAYGSRPGKRLPAACSAISCGARRAAAVTRGSRPGNMTSTPAPVPKTWTGPAGAAFGNTEEESPPTSTITTSLRSFTSPVVPAPFAPPPPGETMRTRPKSWRSPTPSS